MLDVSLVVANLLLPPQTLMRKELIQSFISCFGSAPLLDPIIFTFLSYLRSEISHVTVRSVSMSL